MKNLTTPAKIDNYLKNIRGIGRPGASRQGIWYFLSPETRKPVDTPVKPVLFD